MGRKGRWLLPDPFVRFPLGAEPGVAVGAGVAGDGEKKPAASEINRRRNLRRGRYDATTGHPSADGDTWLRPQWEADERVGK